MRQTSVALDILQNIAKNTNSFLYEIFAKSQTK